MCQNASDKYIVTSRQVSAFTTSDQFKYRIEGASEKM